MSITDAHPGMNRKLKFFPATNNNPQHLTQEQITHFNEKGYLFPFDIFTSKEVEANRAYFETLMKMAEAEGRNSYSINGWHNTCQGIYDLVMEDRILDYVQDLLGENLVCVMTHYFCKMPGDTKQVAWHQDASYWPLSPSKVVTVWLAIDDVDVENAAMEIIPGSHLHGQIPFDPSTPEEDNVLGQSVHTSTAFGDSIPFEMKAGQVSMHTDLLLHGSKPNTSTRRRCGLTLRYMPPDVRRPQEPDGSRGIIARGHDPSGYWQHHPRPQDDQVRHRSSP